MSLSPSKLKKDKGKSALQVMKTYLLKKAENIYKLNLRDEEAFKWKFSKNKNSRPLSSFRLIRTECCQVRQEKITIDDLKDYRFPVLAYKTRQLASFAEMVLKNNGYYINQIKDSKMLNKLVTEISLHYNIVSYHNFSHAFSLSLMMFQCFQYHPQLDQLYTSQDKFWAFIAGLAHDMNHPGTNNAFQIKIKSPRAIQYNNQSVLENFHIKEFWRLLQKNQDINFLNKINNSERVKKFITGLILMTDVAQHFKNLEKLKAISMEARKKENIKENKSALKYFSSEQEKDFLLGQLFHGCDIGNPCVDFDNYISWAALLSYEFNEQTKLEAEIGVQITEMLRYKDLKSFYNGQLGFINFLVFPLWKEIGQLAPELSTFIVNIEKNIEILNKKINSNEQQQKREIQY